MEKDTNRHFREITHGRYSCEKSSASLFVKEILYKTMQYHFIPIKLATIKKPDSTQYQQGSKESGISYTTGGN